MTFQITLLIQVTNLSRVPLVKLTFPSENLPLLRGLHFEPTVDEKGRLVIIGPKISKLPSYSVDKKTGRHLRKFALSVIDPPTLEYWF